MNKSSENKKRYQREYYIKNKEKILVYHNGYRIINGELRANNAKEYRKVTKDKRNEQRRLRFLTDPQFKLSFNIRNLIKQSLKKNKHKKASKTQDILGCTIEEFKQYLESKFEPWMNWSNYGNWNGCTNEINTAWDIDHIIPISIANTVEELLKLNHYTNLQPLCSYTNRHIKSDNVLDV